MRTRTHQQDVVHSFEEFRIFFYLKVDPLGARFRLLFCWRLCPPSFPESEDAHLNVSGRGIEYKYPLSKRYQSQPKKGGEK